MVEEREERSRGGKECHAKIKFCMNIKSERM